MEATEERGRESILIWGEQVQKVTETSKPHFGAQLITRRLQVQVLSPQPISPKTDFNVLCMLKSVLASSGVASIHYAGFILLVA